MSKQQSHIAFSGLCRLFPCRTPYGLLFALTVFLGFIIVWVFSLCSFWYWHCCDALFLKKKDELLLVILATTGIGVLLLETQEEEKQCKNFWKLVGSVAVSIVAFQAFLPYIFELKVITLIALIPAMVLMAGGSLAIINGMGLRLSILLLLGLISCWVPIVILYHEETGIRECRQIRPALPVSAGILTDPVEVPAFAGTTK